MPPPRGRKRKSEASVASTEDHDAKNMAGQKIPTKTGSPELQGSPMKKRKVGISITQKQALIDNLQLEITERARKLRATCNVHAQSLRTRVEIRVNRIPLSLRKVKMGDLLAKYSTEQQQKTTTATASSRPPPVPAKDHIPARLHMHGLGTSMASSATSSRPAKRPSDVLSSGDKENEIERIDNPKKKPRTGPSTETLRDPGQILSPTSSNTRVPARDRAGPANAPASPAKSMIARPVSPTKPATNLLSNMVEKARSTRTAATTRKATNASTASSSNGSSAATTRAKRGVAATAPATTARGAAAARTTRRVSGISESSDGSTSTVVRKQVPARGAAAAAKTTTATTAKRTVMSTIKKGVTGAATTRKTAPRVAPATTGTSTGRVLRKRT